MKIVITARNFRMPDDRAYERLQQEGYEVIDAAMEGCGAGTSEERMTSLIGDADIAITGLEPIGAYVLTHCPHLKLVSRRSIGYDSVDLEACRRHGVAVLRATGTVEAAVAEQVMAYILHFARQLDKQNISMHQGRWERMMTYGAKNRILGLVGFGGIGKEIAKRAVAFGMDVWYYCRHPEEKWETDYQVRYCSFDELLKKSDYLSVNVPLTKETRHMFSSVQFQKMKKESVFINIARGQIVDYEALKKALDEKWIRGAGVDVFDTEPCTDSPLLGCENALLTPHTAPYTSENFSEMNSRAAENVISYFHHTLDKKYILTGD